MSTEFDDILQTDAVNAFLGEFAEDVTYSPAVPTVANPVRTIKAIVHRHTPSPMKGMPDYILPKMLIEVANDATNGIDSSTLDTGGDTITVAYRYGKTAETFHIALAPGQENHDAGMLTLELR